MSDGISDTGKFPKNYFDSFCAQSGATFHFGKPEVDRKQAQDMSDDISEQEKFQKIIPSRLKHIERLFSLIALQKPFHQSRTLQLNVYPFERKFEKIIPSHLEHIERLFLTKAFQKSINIVRKTCLMVYQIQENFKIIPSHFVQILWRLQIIALQNPVKICRTIQLD